ncbi:MAG: T9SS type A sorting domain-containing protein [Bacteroidales bacterium]|nr:T9SS type A sorting domain-containing protein [Bacteroidales bacterium]
MVAGYSNDSTSFDPFVLYYDDLATYNFDGQYDALKIFNTDRNTPNYYVTSDDGRQLSINGVPFCDNIRIFNLGLLTEKDGTIIFKVRDIDKSLSAKTIIINDKVSGINKVLRPDEEYSVFLMAGHYEGRFTLSISSSTVGLPEILVRDDIFRIFSSNGILKLEIDESQRVGGTITLINMTGNVLLRRDIDSPGYYEFSMSFDRGIYIVSFVSEGKISTKKLFLGTN